MKRDQYSKFAQLALSCVYPDSMFSLINNKEETGVDLRPAEYCFSMSNGREKVRSSYLVWEAAHDAEYSEMHSLPSCMSRVKFQPYFAMLSMVL